MGGGGSRGLSIETCCKNFGCFISNFYKNCLTVKLKKLETVSLIKRVVVTYVFTYKLQKKLIPFCNTPFAFLFIHSCL